MPSQNIQDKARSVVIVAGEASGDSHAARLVNELKELDDSILFRGMGGDNLRAAGVDVFIDMSEIAVVGFVEVLKKYNLIKAELNKLKQNIAEQPPDLLILVDFQEFNQRLAAYAKSIGIKVLFYIGPQVWAWRPKRVYKMGLEHLGVVVGDTFDSFVEEHKPVLTGQQFQGPNSTPDPVYILFEDFTHVKFYRLSLQASVSAHHARSFRWF